MLYGPVILSCFRYKKEKEGSFCRFCVFFECVCGTYGVGVIWPHAYVPA